MIDYIKRVLGFSIGSSDSVATIDLDYAGRALTNAERKTVGYTLPQANLDHSKYISKGYIPLEKDVSFLVSKANDFQLNYPDHGKDPLCTLYTCEIRRVDFKAFFTKNNRTATVIQEQVEKMEKYPSEVCVLPKYDCQITLNMVVTFNCIGWAIGISKFIEIETTTSSSPKSILKEFIAKMSDKYQDHPSNFGNVIDGLQVLDSLPDHIANNTAAFYFKNGRFTHASKYITSVNGVEVNQWTSKLGFSTIVTHDEILINNNIYGSDVYYLGVVGEQNSELLDHQEL